MIPVQINYTVRNKVRTITRDMPSEWSELSRALWLKYWQCIKYKKSAQFWMSFMFNALKIRPSLYYKAFMSTKAARIKFNELVASFAWLGGEIGDIKFASNKVPYISGSVRTYYGPGEMFGAMKVLEFAQIDTRLRNTIRKGDRDKMNEILGIMYRPWNFKSLTNYWLKNGDIREPFNHDMVPVYAKRMAKINDAERNAAFFNLVANRAMLPSMFPKVFSTVGAKKPSAFGWSGLIYDMAGDKVGKVSEVNDMYIMDLLFYLEKEETDRIKREQAASRNVLA